LIDGKSRFTWVYLLKNKYDCIDIIPKFFNYIENQFHTIIKVIHSDKARELFLNGTLDQFL